jgi:hypothetical protein
LGAENVILELDFGHLGWDKSLSGKPDTDVLPELTSSDLAGVVMEVVDNWAKASLRDQGDANLV